MVGLAFDCLANPLGAVRVTFEKAVEGSPQNDPAAFDCKDWGAVDVFRKFLFEEGGLDQVPVLDQSNIHLIRPNSLVRYRGMVQDMLGKEFYIGVFKDGSNWNTNKFTDVPQFPIPPASETRLWERRLYHCVPVPGQNSWVSEVSSSPQFHTILTNSHLLNHGEKRSRDENDAAMDLEREATSMCKKQKDGSSSKIDGDVSSSGGSYFEAPASLSCLVKVYDLPESDIKLNDVIEFIGIYTFDPDTALHENNDGDEFLHSLTEDVSLHFPPSKILCLVRARLKYALPDSNNNTYNEDLSSAVRVVRESLLRHLTSVLGNDGLAAQYTLLHLLSRVRGRVDVMVVGKFSLNLTGFTRESASIFGDNLSRWIKDLTPFSDVIPLSVAYLNTAQLRPRKDNVTGRMIPGVLQLAHGTHLTVDETHLATGALNSTGVENAKLLKELLQWQMVGYDCEYYNLDMPADVQVLVISERRSNILPADAIVPFHPEAVNAATWTVLSDELPAWRWYLASCRTLHHHSVSPEMRKVLENDFVGARQLDKTLQGEDLSRWVTMGQLLSASFGESQLTPQHWQMVREMERLRQGRLRVIH
ncbi:E2F target protein 1 (ETG1) isoform X2 [Wolffia australiana]